MKKFKYAINGLVHSLKEKSVFTQVMLGLLAIAGGITINLEPYEWLAFFICIGMVISLELVNSCIEKVCDMYKREYDERIRVIKDYSSGAVLVACFFSLVVCLYVVIRRIVWTKIFY